MFYIQKFTQIYLCINFGVKCKVILELIIVHAYCYINNLNVNMFVEMIIIIYLNNIAWRMKVAD